MIKIKNYNGKPLIAGQGAKDSYPGQFPWLVALFKYLSDIEKEQLGTQRDESFVCGASLLTQWHLLTGENFL
jgi:hypothetical protein